MKKIVRFSLISNGTGCGDIMLMVSSGSLPWIYVNIYELMFGNKIGFRGG